MQPKFEKGDIVFHKHLKALAIVHRTAYGYNDSFCIVDVFHPEKDMVSYNHTWLIDSLRKANDSERKNLLQFLLKHSDKL
jgi:hypothetical protein